MSRNSEDICSLAAAVGCCCRWTGSAAAADEPNAGGNFGCSAVRDQRVTDTLLSAREWASTSRQLDFLHCLRAVKASLLPKFGMPAHEISLGMTHAEGCRVACSPKSSPAAIARCRMYLAVISVVAFTVPDSRKAISSNIARNADEVEFAMPSHCLTPATLRVH